MIYSQFFADSARGIYIPQHFAESVNVDMLSGVDSADMDILRAGPDHENYWDSWQDVLDSAELTDSDGNVWILHQDGDLWVIARDAAIEAVNVETETRREYDESHIDAGNGYAHMPAESWCDADTQELKRQLLESVYVSGEIGNYEREPRWQVLGINAAWQLLDCDALSDIALDSFKMESHYGLAMPNDRVILASYAIGEIEIQLSSVDGVALEYISESCDAYINGDLAYISSDVVWCVVLDVDAFNAAIEAAQT